MKDSDPVLARRALLKALGLGVAASAYAACSDNREVLPGTNLPGTTGGAPAPGTTGGVSAPGATGGVPAPGATGGILAPGNTGGAIAPSSGGASAVADDGVVRERDLVDFHAHFLTQSYVEQATSAGQTPDGAAAWPEWSLDDHLLLMDRAGIAVSVLSLSSPGVHFGDDASARALAKEVNDEAARLVSQAPDRLRFLASLPLPDLDGALEEWRRIQGMPGCIGAVVLSHSHGQYPGDAGLDVLWKEFDDAAAVVLLHPTSPPQWDLVSVGEPRSTMEYYFESVRACMGLIESKVVSRFQGIRFVIPHCGGALPVVLDRIRTFGLGGLTVAPDVTDHELAGLWFDCAGTPFPTQLPALLQQAPLGRVVYGSENCFTPSADVLAQIRSLEAELQDSGEPFRRALAASGKSLLPV